MLEAQQSRISNWDVDLLKPLVLSSDAGLATARCMLASRIAHERSIPQEPSLQLVA